MKHLEYGRKLVNKMRDLVFYKEENKNDNENVINNGFSY